MKLIIFHDDADALILMAERLRTEFRPRLILFDPDDRCPGTDASSSTSPDPADSKAD